MSTKLSAYVTLLSSDSYLEGVLTLNESLRRVQSAHPLDALITEGIAPASRATLERFGIRCHVAASPLLLPSVVREVNERAGLSNWSATLAKLQVFGLTQYRRIVFLDSDMIALENLDHLFSSPQMSAVIAAKSVPGEEEKCPSLNSGLMVIEPAQDLPDQLGERLATVIARGYPMGDQDLLHSFYPEWPTQCHLHLPEGYNSFQIHLDFYVNTLGYRMRTMRRLGGYRRAAQCHDSNRRVHVVHYMGKVKPWMMPIKKCYIYLNILIRRRSLSELRAVALYWRIEARMRMRLRLCIGIWRRPVLSRSSAPRSG